MTQPFTFPNLSYFLHTTTLTSMPLSYQQIRQNASSNCGKAQNTSPKIYMGMPFTFSTVTGLDHSEQARTIEHEHNNALKYQ